MHTVNDAWGVNDTANHGTGLAGVAIYGDMIDALSSTDAIEVGHRLESVKLTPNYGANVGDANSMHICSAQPLHVLKFSMVSANVFLVQQ